MKWNTKTGNAAVELALMLPFLLLILCGFGMIFEKGQQKQRTLIGEQAPLWNDLLK